MPLRPEKMFPPAGNSSQILIAIFQRLPSRKQPDRRASKIRIDSRCSPGI
jgi:hypothetical protein